MTEDISKAERACFEAGIKLGAVYHQFVGTPVTEDSVAGLEGAIEDAVGVQRYVDDVEVEVATPEENRFGYGELEGTMLDVSLSVRVDDVVVHASLSEEDGYPMMRVDEVERR